MEYYAFINDFSSHELKLLASTRIVMFIKCFHKERMFIKYFHKEYVFIKCFQLQ